MSKTFRVTAHAALFSLTAWYVYLAVSAYLANKFYTHDVGNIEYVVYNTWHGRFLWVPSTQRCDYASHFTTIFFLIVPLHAIVRHVLLIPILETLALLSGAWAVAWLFDGLSRHGRKLNKTPKFSPMGLALGWLYATNVLTGSMALSYHYESFFVGFTLWALAALANQRKRLFWILLILALGCKTDIALYWGTFGAWWIVFGWEKQRRGYSGAKRFPLGAWLMGLSAVWLAMGLATVAWYARRAGLDESEFTPRYAWLGQTFGDKIGTFFTHPKAVYYPLWKAGWILLPTVIFLPLLAPEALLLLAPGAYVMGLAEFFPMADLLYYYSYPLIPFLFLSLCLGMARLLRWTGRGRFGRWRRQTRVAFVAFVLLAGCWALFQPTRTEGKKRVPEKYTERHGWIRMVLRETIPRDASVAAQFDLLCQLPLRENIYPLDETMIDRAEYWVFDLAGFRGDIDRDTYVRLYEKARRLVDEKRARIVVDQNRLFIIHRPLPDPKKENKT